MHGNTGKIAWIDLARREVEIIALPVEVYRRFIGGSGLAAKLFWDRTDFTAGPLTPEALLIFMNGPLAGARLSGASRMSAAVRSPLTGAYADSSCGGYFPPALRHAGFDGLAITGKAAAPSLLRIAGGSIAIEEGCRRYAPSRGGLSRRPPWPRRWWRRR
ncbi:MAG TPA: hypothetical protein ENN21_06880 [Spirochaetes bacterium]|nr:hypothetical protein [Spirochaetota bacterium]